MKRFLFPVWGLIIVAACARTPPSTRPQPLPQPAPAPAGAQPTPSVSPTAPSPAARPPFEMETGANPDAVPAFAASPLITWGPLPAGTSHAERVRTFDLQHQIVTLRFDWTRQAVVGSTTLRIAGMSGAAPLATVAIDAGDMTFSRVSATGGQPLKYDYDGHTLTIHLASPLRAGARASITIDYTGVNRTKGAYFRPARHIVWTQGETEDNRYWVPTYDFPNDKTTWEFYIWSAKGERALSNGRLAGSRTVRDSIEWHWVQAKPASTYLMTTVVGKYTVLQDKAWHGIPIGYWTYPDSIQAAWRGFAKTPAAVDVFSRKTGVPYPWAKYDQIVIPQFQYGGMENVSATSQNDEAILHPAWSEPEASTTGLMAHELGHQWYGDLLTTRRWADVWLNEGFATFMEQVFREEDQGVDEGAIDRLSAQEQTIGADRRARRPVVYDKWVNDPIEVFFSGHIYPKGATILQMLRHQSGDALFWKAMNRYTTFHAYGNVVSDDLRVAFEQTTGRNFKPFFQQWVYGAGFPVFRVSSTYDSGARSLLISATEVQARDSLTGFFDVDVDVEVRTDSGVVKFVVPVRQGSGEHRQTLKAAPRSIVWDKGNWILDLTDFPRSTAMLQYELTHDDDVLGRTEAVEVLRARPADPTALAALIAASHSDRSWFVRQRGVRALGNWIADSSRASSSTAQSVKMALLDATHDNDSRIRSSAARAVGEIASSSLKTPDLIARLRALATTDPSLFVRASALASYVRVDGNSALPLAREMLVPDVWRDVIRVPVVDALKTLNSPEATELVRRYSPPRQE